MNIKTLWGISIVFFSGMFFSCHAQDTAEADQSYYLVGGPCEGCEAVLEYGDRTLTSVDTLPDFDKPGPKLKISGTIYQPDGKTPAEGVILYVYHTNQEGVYPTRGDEEGWARRHGYIRGWVKTDADGRYAFYTLKPGHYPGRRAPAHIHPIILEPGGAYYYVGDYLFEDDPLVSDRARNQKQPRGGSRKVIAPEKEGELLVATRDFILGKNIPGYK